MCIRDRMSYCAYQERSSFEVKTKAKNLGLNSNEIEKAIKNLIDENFLNEKRFAEAFISGKINIKRWGKYKLLDGLFQKGVDQKIGNKIIDEIDEELYLKNLNYWVREI